MIALTYSISFWKDFEFFYLSLTKQQINLNLKHILIGLLTPELPLPNYLLLIGENYLWSCRRNKELPSERGFKSKVKLKYAKFNVKNMAFMLFNDLKGIEKKGWSHPTYRAWIHA